MEIVLSSLKKTISLVIIILITGSITLAKDNGEKDKKSENISNEQVKKNTKEDIGGQVQLKYTGTISTYPVESEEDRANWYISQSLPKPEKVCKKEESELAKINRKIIKKERKECKKLQKSIKKGEYQTKSE